MVPDPDALQLGSPLLINQQKAFLVNGVFGICTQKFPYDSVTVQQGECSKFRSIAALGVDTCEPKF